MFKFTLTFTSALLRPRFFWKSERQEVEIRHTTYPDLMKPSTPCWSCPLDHALDHAPG